jgi:predicted alpha/beta-fold hydrolase
MSSWLSKGAKAALVGAAGYTVYKFVTSMADEEHSFVPNGPFKTRADRVAALRRGEISMPQTLGYNTFLNKDGLYIHWVKWMPLPGVHPQLKGIVVLCHGIAEYARRYEHVAEELNRKGFGVIAVDHQGHGQSEGDRCYFKNMEDLADDVLQLVHQEAPKHPDADLFLLGHSMGGCVAMHTYLKSPELWKGMVLSAPALGHDPKLPPALRPVAKAIANMLPKVNDLDLDLDCVLCCWFDCLCNEPAFTCFCQLLLDFDVGRLNRAILKVM